MKITFHSEKAFEACRAAENKARKLGMLVGIMQRDEPIALVKNKRGAENPGKWKYLANAFLENIAGTITGSKHTGPVTLTIFDDNDKNPYRSEQ